MVSRVRAIIRTKEGFVLIYRYWNNKEFYCFPGGRIDNGETEEMCLKRECLEELGAYIEICSLFSRYRDQNYYFAKILSGKIGSGEGSEFQNSNNSNNIYKVEVHKDLNTIKMIPDQVRLKLLKFLEEDND